jgi:hypothetical protein
MLLYVAFVAPKMSAGRIKVNAAHGMGAQRY